MMASRSYTYGAHQARPHVIELKSSPESPKTQKVVASRSFKWCYVRSLTIASKHADDSGCESTLEEKRGRSSLISEHRTVGPLHEGSGDEEETWQCFRVHRSRLRWA